MKHLITALTVLLSCSTVCAQMDAGHSIFRSAAFSQSGGCADGSCSLNVARGGLMMSRVATTQVENVSSTVVTSTTAAGEYYSDSFATSYLEDATEYTNHIVIIRRTPDVETDVLHAVGEPLATFSALHNE